MRTSAFELRYSDHSLDEQQKTFQAELSKFFSRHWSTAKVRATSDGRIDAALFDGLQEMGLLSMVLSTGEEGVGLTDLLITAEVAGAALCTFPLAEVWCATRFLVALGIEDINLSDSTALPALAFQNLEEDQLIPWGAATVNVVGMKGRSPVQLQLQEPLRSAGSTCGVAFGYWDHSVQCTTVAVGKEIEPLLRETLWEQCLDEWRLLTAALAVGAASTAVAQAVSFANDRQTRGVAIATLQAISHPLADAHIGLIASRNLARRAAWLHDHEPGQYPLLARLALAHANRAASRAAHTAIHVHGGQGVSVESDVTLAFTRARQWPLVAGNPERLLVEVGRKLIRSETRSHPSTRVGHI